MQAESRVTILCLLSLLNSGCQKSVASPRKSNSGDAQPIVESQANANPAQSAAFLDNGVLEARDLASYLGISVWAFNYSGGRVKCWLEITEDGATTKFPPEAAQDLNKADPEARHGKIILWMKQRELEIRLNSGTSENQYITRLRDDSLWLGKPGPYGRSSKSLQKAVTPTPGDTVTLLELVGDQYDDAPEPPKTGTIPARKVVRSGKVVLKAEFPKED